jgi:hypothetical protein
MHGVYQLVMLCNSNDVDYLKRERVLMKLQCPALSFCTEISLKTVTRNFVVTCLRNEIRTWGSIKSRCTNHYISAFHGKTSGTPKIYCHVSWVPWLIITGSGLDLLTPSFTATLNYNYNSSQSIYCRGLAPCSFSSLNSLTTSELDYWTELNWTELNWTELNWTELNWTDCAFSRVLPL